MKILFVSGNRERLPDAVIPLGLLYVMASTPARYEKVFLDLCFEADPNSALSDTLRANQPDLIAISMRNIQNNDYTGLSDNLDYYASLVATCKANSLAPVVLGGAGFSIMPGQLMVRLKADFGISGEGEMAFPRLLEAIELGSLANVPGLYRLETDAETAFVNSSPKTASPEFVDMTALSTPDRSCVNRRYYDEYGIDLVLIRGQTTLGQPSRCVTLAAGDVRPIA